MTNIQSPSHFQAGVFTLPCTNTTDEEIPAYGVMAIRPAEGTGPPVTKGTGAATEMGAGPMVVSVRKPEAEDITIGSPAVFCFNVSTPIPANGKGRCTFGFPAFVQLEPEEARVQGKFVGPKADSWTLHPGRGMFCVRTWWIKGETDIGLVDRGSPGLLMHFSTPVGGIPAADGNQMGSAVCHVMTCDENGLLTDAEYTETVYNSTSGDVQGLMRMAAHRNEAGLIVVTVEDCQGA